MTIQLNFDQPNKKRLLKMIEWLKEVGIIKSYKFSNAIIEIGKDDINTLLKKDSSGILAKLSKDELEGLLQQAHERALQVNEGKVTPALAAILYDKEMFSAGQAAQFSGTDKASFIRQLGKYKVSAFGESIEDINVL